MESFICRPERDPPHPAVLFLMDAPGIREELRDMARRLACVGYYVVLPNLYYRAGRDTFFGPTVLTKGDPEYIRMRAIRQLGRPSNAQQGSTGSVLGASLDWRKSPQVSRRGVPEPQGPSKRHGPG